MRIFDYPMTPIDAQPALVSVELNAPISESRRVTVRGDRFVAAGGDLPLFGVNLGWPFIDSRAAFEFLSTMGVNVVRIGGPFREWGSNGRATPMTPALVAPPRRRFDSICRQQKLCEELGIYVVIRDLAEGLGPPYYPAEDFEQYRVYDQSDACSLGLWHPGVRQLVMKRLEALLCAENPHTKRPFGASPALMGIQLTNETSWFGDDPHLGRSKRWPQIQRAPERILDGMATAAGITKEELVRLQPEERLTYLALATADAYAEAKKLMAEKMGSKRPLLIADNAPWVAAVAASAFAPCDALGWSFYPDHGSLPDSQARVKPFDLRSDRMMDRMQVRLAGKPTLITECGERLAAGGQARLIADATVRAATYGYAGLIFHFVYKGLYGDKSAERSWLSNRTPRENFDIGCDPAALCSLQACSLIFRNRLVPRSPKSVTVSASSSYMAAMAVRKGRQLDDTLALASDISEQPLKLGSLSTTILLREGPRNVAEASDPSFSGNIERGHVRAGALEMDWGTFDNPEEDWLFIRVPLKKMDNLIVITGRPTLMPPPAEQKFERGIAKLSGFKSYPWPNPNTGFGEVFFVRRPEGPQIRIEGEVLLINADGTGGQIEVENKSHGLLPGYSIRYLERR